MKGVQCYEFFGGIALKNHAFTFFHLSLTVIMNAIFLQSNPYSLIQTFEAALFWKKKKIDTNLNLSRKSVFHRTLFFIIKC